MSDFKTVNPGDTIKLSDELTVEVVSVESSELMTVRKVEPLDGE